MYQYGIQRVNERYSDSKIQDKINGLERLKSSVLISEPNISKRMAAGNTIDQCVKIWKINLSKKADKRQTDNLLCQIHEKANRGR